MRASARSSEENALRKRTQLNINKAIGDVIPLIRREINVRGVSLRLDLAPSLPLVDGDRIQLQQVIMNLLMNGIQAMSAVTGRHRELQIRSREHGSDQILVAVEDSGIGIDPANVDQVFNAFFTTKPDGIGMGLSICRSIIEQHGGRIWAGNNIRAGVQRFRVHIVHCVEAAARPPVTPYHSSTQRYDIFLPGAPSNHRRQPHGAAANGTASTGTTHLVRMRTMRIDPTVVVRYPSVRQRGRQSSEIGSRSPITTPDAAERPAHIRLPGVSGLDFQAKLAEADIRIPIIFMTGHGDIPMSVKAMKAGAIDFLTKPFRDQDILDAVMRAIERDQIRRNSEKDVSELRVLFASLTSREREVMTSVAAGLMNKQIAAELSLSEITVKVHRGHMIKKMKARSVIDLVGMADLLGIRNPKR